MFNRTRSIVSILTILTLVVFSLPLAATAQKSGRSAAAESPTAVLYSNANIQTGTGNGFNGANTSIIPLTPAGSNSLGFNLNGTLATPIHLGDRFTLTAASTISSIVFFPYSTSAAYPFPPTTPFTGATVRIWNGRPGNGGIVVATSSTFGGSAWTGIYRVSSTTLTGATRPVFSLQTNFPNTPLAAGNYWATISVTGIGAPGVAGSCFAPPVVNPDATFPTAYPNLGASESVQSLDNQATWTSPLQDGGSLQSVFIPIIVNGTAVTAAGVNISGRVLSSAGGRGLTGAAVRLTDQNGITRTVVTGRLGTFAFDDVEPGQTYVVSVASRRFNFAPRVIQVVDNVVGLEFVPE